MRIFAGECTTRFEGTRERLQRGWVVVLVKTDKTVLVHDATGYQPVAWLTRPDSLTIETDGRGFGLTARTDEQVLRVVSHTVSGRAVYPATRAGIPVGECPECAGPLVRTGGDVVCLGCAAGYSLPPGATVLDSTCEDCGLPEIRVARGDRFELCLDRACDPLDDHVRDRFDREWDCPDCGDDLRIVRAGGGLLAGCDAYPDCDTAFSISAGVVTDTCPCGLPVFDTAAGPRCLDGTCDRFGS
ncbi:MAG: topoisomerase DNA-binding C4 zinc finger domain-containing protein [Halobacteriota archaeon]